jgi:hypothetical protein
MAAMASRHAKSRKIAFSAILRLDVEKAGGVAFSAC